MLPRVIGSKFPAKPHHLGQAGRAGKIRHRGGLTDSGGMGGFYWVIFIMDEELHSALRIQSVLPGQQFNRYQLVSQLHTFMQTPAGCQVCLIGCESATSARRGEGSTCEGTRPEGPEDPTGLYHTGHPRKNLLEQLSYFLAFMPAQ